MNTITVQLTEAQYQDMQTLIGYGEDRLSRIIEDEVSDEVLAEHTALQQGVPSLVEALTTTKTYLWTSGCGRLELEIPAEAVDDIARSSDNLPAVERWLTQRNYLSKQVGDLDVFTMAEHLKDAGLDIDAWTIYQVRQHVLWLACHDIADERNQED